MALVTDELERMGRYVEDLLLLAKAEQHQFLRLGPADVGELVTNLMPRAGALGLADGWSMRRPGQDWWPSPTPRASTRRC